MGNFILTNIHAIGQGFFFLIAITIAASLIIHALENRGARRREAALVRRQKASQHQRDLGRRSAYRVRYENGPEKAHWN